MLEEAATNVDAKASDTSVGGGGGGLEVREVVASRLRHSRWSHEFNRSVGEGDIVASYSADRIGQGKSLRRPFLWCDQLWIGVGTVTSDIRDVLEVKAYRLVPIDHYNERHQGEREGHAWGTSGGRGFFGSYAEKTADGEAARKDPDGFYHGIIVQYRSGHFVLCGPPVIFRPGDTQLGLFGELEEHANIEPSSP